MTTPPTVGQQQPFTGSSLRNVIEFVARQLVFGQVDTSSLVQVVAVHGGGVGPVGTVDVQPLVNQVDGAGNGTPHGTVYGLPYIRLQGGSGAVICDPVEGDVGQAIYCSSDISTVKATPQETLAGGGQTFNPGSFRRFSMSDGLYLGGTLNGTPTSYIQIVDGQVIVSASNGACVTTIGPSGVVVGGTNGNLSTTGNLSAGNGVTGMFTTPTGQTVTIQNGIVTNIY